MMQVSKIYPDFSFSQPLEFGSSFSIIIHILFLFLFCVSENCIKLVNSFFDFLYCTSVTVQSCFAAHTCYIYIYIFLLFYCLITISRRVYSSRSLQHLSINRISQKICWRSSNTLFRSPSPISILWLVALSPTQPKTLPRMLFSLIAKTVMELDSSMHLWT